jgi:replicative DNA helicase
MSPVQADLVFTGSQVKGVGIITGAVSGNLEVIDVDCKYDLTGSLWTELKSLIYEHLPANTAKSLVIARTKSGGYHIYYRSPKIEGNLKLANRPTTPEEKAETYKQAIAKSEPEEKAQKQSANDKVKVLLETRGEGGYVVAAPTPGYEFIQGNASQIPTIKQEEREILFTLARSFNELSEPEPKQNDYVKSAPYVNNGLSPFDDYNQRAHIVELLEANGWKQVGRSGERIYFKRPGNTDSKTSANYHTGLKTFYVFSTSTEFENGKGYNPTGVYTLLECNGDFSLASRRLYEQGYGDRHQSKAKQKLTQVKTDLIRVEAITEIGETITLSKPGDTLKIEKLIAGELKKIYVYYESEDAGAEILKALDLLENATESVRIYVTQTDELQAITNKQPSQPPYEFRLQRLLQHYGKLEETKGSLDAEDIDSLLADAVTIAANLWEPTDRDRFTKLFTTLEAVKDLGITEESLRATEEKLRYKAEQEKKDRSLSKLLDNAAELREQGKLQEAFTALETSLQNIKTDSGKDLLPPALTSEDILSRIAETAPAFKTGYKDLDKFVGFTPGAITLVAGRPSHGKTTFMFNLLLEMSRAYAPEDYKFYFFTYEEPLKNLSVKLLNRLVGADLSRYYSSFAALARPTNYEFLKAYVKAGRTDISEIEKGKEAFRTFIDSGLITVIDRNYSVEELASLIAYQSQREKIGAVFIDYIQRMRTERRTQDKRTEIAHISDQVLQIAKENNLPLILGAQLNRSTLSGTKKPSLENLKEAGNLEEDANTVLSVYNESREKDEDTEGTRYSKQREVDLEIKALKNREGEVNQTAVLVFDKWTGVIKEKTATANHF